MGLKKYSIIKITIKYVKLRKIHFWNFKIGPATREQAELCTCIASVDTYDVNCKFMSQAIVYATRVLSPNILCNVSVPQPPCSRLHTCESCSTIRLAGGSL